MVAYRERRKLSGPSLLEDGHNLRQFARHSQQSRPSLQILQHAHTRHTLTVKRISSTRQPGDKHRGCRPLPTELQHQHRNSHILDRNQRHLAIGAEWELVPDIICQADEVARRLEQVAQEGNALGGLGVEEFEQLWDFDDAARADDADAEGFGDGEFEALRVGQVDVVDEGAVAGVAEELGCGLLDWAGEVVGYGCEDGAEGLFEGLHRCARWLEEGRRGCLGG